MDRVKGSMKVLSTMQLTKDMAGMDVQSKELLRNKEVLAVILEGVVAEYKGYSRKEIMDFIETDSITDETEVSPGRTNTKVLGDSAEFAELNEKVSYFDLAFRAKNPALTEAGVLVSLHVDVEAQKTYRPGYPIEKRGMYYLARRLSSQLSLLTETTDYGQLEKCYSIWICRDDIPRRMRNSCSVYEVVNTKETSQNPVARENYDLLTLVVIKLGDKVYNGKKEDEGYELLRFLNTIMYPHKEDFMDTVSEYIDFSHNEELWKEVTHVSGLGECIFKDGLEEGAQKERAEAVLELLEEYGTVPDELRKKISSEVNLELLRRWHKIAAKSTSIEEFQKNTV
ncbi:MAG: hypothetical protein K2N46_06415 [Lachnospiraceae bacterium]|nr:hypothetical protein [Lachnospiraceae bacterium]